MKKLIAVIGVVIVLIISAYYGMGVIAERSMNRVVQDAVTQGIKLELVRYNRGLFCSHILLNWVVPNFPQAGKATETVVPVSLVVYHGPLILTKRSVDLGFGLAKGEISVPDAYQAEIQKLVSSDSTLPVVHLEVLINFANHAHISVGVKPFQFTMQANQSKFAWLGFTNDIHLSMHLNDVSGHSQLRGIELDHDQKHVVLGPVESQFKLKKAEFGLYEGTASFALSDLKVTSQNQNEMEVQSLSIATDSSIQSGLVDSHFLGELGQFKFGNQNYGPGKLEVTLNHLDAEVLGRVKHTLQGAQAQSMIARQRSFIGLIPEIPRVFMKGAVFSISQLSLKLPDGQLEATLTLSAPDATNVKNPFQLFSKVTGQGHISAPTAIVRQIVEDAYRQKMQYQSVVPAPSQTTVPEVNTEEQVKQVLDKRFETLLASGAIVQEGNNYVLDLKLENGKVMVNGQPFAPAMLEF